jgi:hypothetical protein
MKIDLENLGRLVELMESISTTTRDDLMKLTYGPDELRERRDLFERMSTTTRMTYNYLKYVVEIYEQSDPILFLREMDAQLVEHTAKEDLAKYKELFIYTGD